MILLLLFYILVCFLCDIKKTVSALKNHWNRGHNFTREYQVDIGIGMLLMLCYQPIGVNEDYHLYRSAITNHDELMNTMSLIVTIFQVCNKRTQ